ncbi:MAG: hypothetical protein ACXAC2_14250 [Candidatus Kariarchaeaceae archaeon]|jgi:hypothetical protein
MVRLIFKDRNFSEGREQTGDAVLILDEATSTGKLEYSSTSLILRRTARRQAESICKAGFLLSNGKRIGIGFKLESDEDKIEDRLLQKGYDYR